MKGFLVWHDIASRKTHDVGVLRDLCVEIDPSLAEVCDPAEKLGDYVAVFRYPPNKEATPLEAISALKLARDVYEALLARLPREVRPEKSP